VKVIVEREIINDEDELRLLQSWGEMINTDPKKHSETAVISKLMERFLWTGSRTAPDTNARRSEKPRRRARPRRHRDVHRADSEASKVIVMAAARRENAKAG